MMFVEYFWAKLLLKLKGRAILKSKIDKTSKVEAGSSVVNSSFDKHSFCGYNCQVVNADIGKFCSISDYVSIGRAGRHPVEYVSTSPVFLSHKDSVKTKFARHEYLTNLRTKIGHDVWIGDKALVKAGVKIGNGAVIGMGSVVTKDVPHYSIVGGNPARKIKNRFNQDVIEVLLDLKWWDLPEGDLKSLAVNFNDIAKFIKQVREL